MSKSTKIIAGAGVAALAIAAIPAVGSFANDPTTDIDYKVTIEPTLTLKVNDVDVTDASYVAPTDQAYTLLNGAAGDSSKSVKFTAITNNVTGYTLNALDADAALVGQGNISSKSIAYGTPAAGDTSAWNLSVSGTALGEAALRAGTAVVATQATATATEGVDTTVVYNASVSKAQEAGTYKGTVTYTLSANA